MRAVFYHSGELTYSGWTWLNDSYIHLHFVDLSGRAWVVCLDRFNITSRLTDSDREQIMQGRIIGNIFQPDKHGNVQDDNITKSTVDLGTTAEFMAFLEGFGVFKAIEDKTAEDGLEPEY